ncbi:MAG: PD-(D/E)XK motif protein [Crocinitomicaceae bacterium]|nr:PD-(D/E)XK motif protein [Crocinitomicaceae bacterium]
MLFLKILVEQSNSSNINETLNSWKGPYDKGHDFELSVRDIEIKTRTFLRKK